MEINISLFILADSGAHVKVALSVEPSSTLESLVIRSRSACLVTEEIGDLLKHTDNIDFVVFGEIVDKTKRSALCFVKLLQQLMMLMTIRRGGPGEMKWGE